MLATLLLLAATSVGQTPAEKVDVTLRSDGRYWAKDDAGTYWFDSDPINLRRHVASRNLAVAPAPDRNPAPAPDAAPAAQALPTGVTTGKFPKIEAGHAWYGGNVTTPPVVGASGKKIERLHLTVIGSGAEGVKRRWEESPAFRSIQVSLGDRLAVQAYDDPARADQVAPGLTGKVVLQDASGKVLRRWPVEPEADDVVGELRRRDPHYDPARDPSGGPIFGNYHEYATAVLAGVLVIGFILLLRSPKS